MHISYQNFIIQNTPKYNIINKKTAGKNNSSQNDCTNCSDKIIKNTYYMPVFTSKKNQNSISDNEIINTINHQQQICLNKPYLYINSDNLSEEEQKKAVNEFFKSNYEALVLTNTIYDKITVNAILRKRFDKAEKIVNALSELSQDKLHLLKDLCQNENVKFSTNDKIELIRLLKYQDDSTFDPNEETKRLAETNYNLQMIKKSIFDNAMEEAGINFEPVQDEKHYKEWDFDYVHLIAKQIKENNDGGALEDVINGVNSGNFLEYITDRKNIYSLSNSITEELFENELDINYKKWLNPAKACDVHFVYSDLNHEKLNKIAIQLTKDIELLRTTPAKKFIDRQLKPYIKNDKFAFPENVTGSKPLLLDYSTNIIKQLDTLWRRAKKNSTSPIPEVKELAQKVMLINNHLNCIIDDIHKISDKKSGSDYDITIKMWDRMPQRDLFQGNYSTCCVGLGEVNGDMAAKYLLHTCFNMIELIDNKSGNTIGNALCYFVKIDNKPAFIIDNIEINNSYKPPEEIGNKIRDAIVVYSQNLIRYISKNPANNDMPIYMSYRYNDVPTSDEFPSQKKSVNFIGDIRSDIYLDVYGGHVFNSEELNREVQLCKLK